MSEPVDRDLEQQLAAWLAMRAPETVPAALTARVMAIAGTQAPSARPRLAFPPREARSRVAALAALAAAVLVVGLVGGFLVPRRLDPDVTAATPALLSPEVPSPAPIATFSPSPATASSSPPPFRSGGLLPGSIPATIPHGIVDTPIGRARWVHLQGDATTLPDPVVPILAPGGELAWFDDGHLHDICFNGGEARPECTNPRGVSLSFSTDLLANRVKQPLPVSALHGQLIATGDTYWLQTTDPFSISRSTDLRTWEVTDTASLRSPGPASLSWSDPEGYPVSAGRPVELLTFTAADPGSLLGYPGRRVYLARKGNGYVARELHSTFEGGDVDLGPIEVTIDARGLVLRNGGGREVGRVEGVGLEFVEAWERRRSIVDYLLAYLDGSTWVATELPDAAFGDNPALVALGTAAFVFAPQADGTVASWTSDDGRTWTTTGLLVDDAGNELRSQGVWYRDDERGVRTLVATTTGGDAGWVSADGATWTGDRASDAGVPPVRLDSGWVRTGDQTDDASWQVSRDGAAWADATGLREVITKTAPSGAGGSSESSIENVVIFNVDEVRGTRDVWLIEFEEPSP